jgi:Ca2+-transporting ATPase
MTNNKKNSQGLSNDEVIASRKKNGANSIEHQQKNHFLASLSEMVKEPMFILLIAAASIYFISGDYGDGIFMSVSIFFVAAISLFQ